MADSSRLLLRRRGADDSPHVAEHFQADLQPDGDVSVDGQSFRVLEVTRGTYRVTDQGPRPKAQGPGTDDQRPSPSWVVYVAGSAEACWAFADGFVYELETAPEAAGRHAAGAADKADRVKDEEDLKAPMPATVARILVTPGQAVTQGETVIILEAMKMELPIRSPRSGTVKAIRCREGELVQPGVSLIEVE